MIHYAFKRTFALRGGAEHVERVLVRGIVADVDRVDIFVLVESERLQKPHERLALVPVDLRLELEHHLAAVASCCQHSSEHS